MALDVAYAGRITIIQLRVASCQRGYDLGRPYYSDSTLSRGPLCLLNRSLHRALKHVSHLELELFLPFRMHPHRTSMIINSIY